MDDPENCASFVNQLRLKVRAGGGAAEEVWKREHRSVGRWGAGRGWWNPRLLQMCREFDVNSSAALPFIASRLTLGGVGWGGTGTASALSLP